jgi:hypothetical protein
MKKPAYYANLDQLTADLETLADWKDDLSDRISRLELCSQSSVGVHDGQRDRLIREGEAFKHACNSLMKRLRRDE